MIFYFKYRKALKEKHEAESRLRVVEECTELKRKQNKTLTESLDAERERHQITKEQLKEVLKDNAKITNLLSVIAPKYTQGRDILSDYKFVIEKFEYGFKFFICGRNNVAIAHSQYYKNRHNARTAIQKLVRAVGGFYEPDIEDRTK